MHGPASLERDAGHSRELESHVDDCLDVRRSLVVWRTISELLKDVTCSPTRVSVARGGEAIDHALLEHAA
jgi:hypothetical protein